MMIGFALSPGSATFVPVDVTQSGDGYSVSDDGVNITFTGTEGRFAGLSVVLSKVDLAVGPVAYGAPVLSGDGTPEVGEVLSITPVEMWFYDAGRGAPVIDYVTDGVNAVDGLTLPLGAGDAGRDVTVTERASYDGSSFATAVSNVIRVEGIAAPDPTVPEAFGTEEFSLADNADGTIALAITALPGDGGAALTDVEYSTDGAGTWRVLAGFAGTGSYDLALASDGTALEAGDYDVALRAVNTVGAGAASGVLSVTVTLPAGGGLSVTEIEGQVTINTDDPDDISVTISGNPAYNGSYVIVRADLAAGPVNLLPAAIAYTDATETELTHVPGLWVTDEDSVTVDLIWQSDGADILNANTPNLQITEADAGATLTLLETATDTNGTRSQASNGIAIPVANTGGGAPDVFEATFDTVIDPLSSSADWESVSLSGAPALSDGTVARPGDAGASERLLATLSLPQAQFTEWRFGEIGVSPSAQYRHVLRSNRGGLYLFFRHISNQLSDFRIQTVGGANYRIGSTLNHPVQVGALYRAEITDAGEVTLTEDGVEIFAATLGAGDNAVIADAAGMDFRPSGQVQHHTISYFRAGALA